MRENRVVRANTMIEAGTVLQNRYRIDQQIGQGGMGKVYVATDERFKSRVAIKETVFEDANLRKAFEREARLLNSLKHTSLPRVSDHFSENEGQFLVMEFIAGEDLAERMEKNGEAFSLETVLDWANQLCRALEYLHAQDIIHRDIKPQNLKLAPNNQIVLLDFGLAKGNPTDAPHQTAAKSIFGFSRSYASLEQIQGAGTEPRSDLYSLAATVYHLLTGIPPADALTRAMNVLNKKSDPLIPANLINGEVPKGVAEVLQKAMALNADERPESAEAMREMLDASDKTIDFNHSESIIEKSLATDFLLQDTKIIGAKTNVSPEVKSEIETEIAPARLAEKSPYRTRITDGENELKQTLVQKSANTESPRRTKAVGATIAGILVLIGSLFSAAYFLNSNSSSPSGANAEKKNAFLENTNARATGSLPVAVNNNANLQTANAVIAEQQNSDQPKIEIVPAPPVETTKNNQKKPSPNAPKATAKTDGKNSGEDNIVVNEDAVEMGDMIIDEDGIRDKKTGKFVVPKPPKPPIQPNPKATEVEPNYMTPEQLRKLEMFRRRIESGKKRVVILNKPEPKPTP